MNLPRLLFQTMKISNKRDGERKVLEKRAKEITTRGRGDGGKGTMKIWTIMKDLVYIGKRRGHLQKFVIGFQVDLKAENIGDQKDMNMRSMIMMMMTMIN